MCVHYLAERVCVVSQFLKYWRVLSQVVVGVAQINAVTNHGNTQLIVKPADKTKQEIMRYATANIRDVTKHSAHDSIWFTFFLFNNISSRQIEYNDPLFVRTLQKYHCWLKWYCAPD